ncbi:MAG: hypothetical protein U0R24_06190 [Solirubrobacterales bacterium]
MRSRAVLGLALVGCAAAFVATGSASAAVVERVVDGGFEATTGCQGSDINSCTNPNWTKTETVPNYPQARFCLSPPCTGAAASGAGFISLGNNARSNPGHVSEIGSISQPVDFTGVTTLTYKLTQVVVLGYTGPVEVLVDGSVVDTKLPTAPGYGSGYKTVSVDVSGVSPGVHTLTLRVNCSYHASQPCAWWNIDDVSALATVADPPTPPTAPETTIAKGPKKRTKSKRVAFEFNSSTAGATFECALDGAAFAPCASPLTVKAGKGKHNFQVRAVASGLTDATPASYGWTVKKKKGKKGGGGHHGGGKG